MKQPDVDDLGDNLDLMRERFRMAEQYIADAKLAYEHESNNSAVNRAYYALFKTISALQALEGLSFSSHGQAIYNGPKDLDQR